MSGKDLPGGYCLVLNREFDAYRVQDCSWSNRRKQFDEGVGVLEGTVTSIGWNDTAIVAYRWSCCGKGDGFMILNTRSGTIEGPFGRDAMDKRLASDSRLQGVVVRPAHEVRP